MPPSVLVTGARGFIGRAALSALRARGCDVHAVSSQPVAASDDDGVVWHQGDLLDAGATARVVGEAGASHLLHLAWDLRPGAWAAAGAHLAWLRASLDLIERFAAGGGTRIVTVGTCAEYDWSDGLCAEGVTPTVPASLYGAAKLALAQVTATFARQGRLSAASARIFFTFGPGEHPDRLVATVIRALVEGRAAECTDGRQARDFLFVADVAEALAALVSSPVTGPVNIGSGRAVRVRDLVTDIGDLLGRPELIRLGAKATQSEEPPLVVADVTRLTSEVGFQPQHSLRSGLEQSIAWWQARTSETLQ